MEFENVTSVIQRMLFQDLRELMSLGGTAGNRNRNEPPVPKSRMVQKALLSRMIILLAMAVSCFVLPNHNPGDDVFQFPLRHPPNGNTPCFCRKGQACEDDPTTFMDGGCADKEPIGKRYVLVDSTYSFLLTPLTRWDASRFLQLAVYPSARDPIPISKEEFPQCDNQQEAYSEEDCQALFLPSEQAHAFFPMLPLIIRTIAKVLMDCIPSRLLPSTYEGVVVLSALLWNAFCFVLAALALYDLTLGLTQRHFQNLVTDNKLPRFYPQKISYRVFLLFCVNPASVFFTTVYSESTFAMCNFVGHALFMRGMSDKQQLTSFLQCLAALPFWIAASYTRSNGSINGIWLILTGLGMACYYYPGPKKQYVRATVGLLLCTLMSMAVAYPIYWHDAAGYERHCQVDGITPSWCSGDVSFSLYGYVQKKHWNVGIFHYYTLKKIPNFLFAAPILTLSILAVADWIQTSWNCAGTRAVSNFIGWAIEALKASVGWFDVGTKPAPPTATGNNSRVHNLTQQIDQTLLLGPLMLGHYAVLAAVCAVGILVAHIEITTRMICSSCPAIYWYMALCIGALKDADKSASMVSKCRFLLKKPILPYCFLYILLGVVMHPNWLPWT